MRSFSFSAALAMISLCLGGCHEARQASPAVLAGRNVNPAYLFRPEDQRQAARRRLAAGPSKDFHLLFLSGGGAYGAWGAGVLCGWGEKRPTFDIVTGVSTGAILATFAFLGDDPMLREAYLNKTTSDIYTPKFLPAAPFLRSLYSTEPLKALIHTYIDDVRIDRVADAGRQGRRLYASTTDLDTGQLVTWDLTGVAMDRGNPGRYDRFRDVILASASIPVVFPPVTIDGALYVDGGIRGPEMVRRELLPMARAAVEEARREHVKTAPPVDVCIIINNRVGVPAKAIDDRVIPISKRTIECMLDSTFVDFLEQARGGASQYGYRLSVSYVPPDAVKFDSNEFDPVLMQQVFEQGFRWGRDNRWSDPAAEGAAGPP